MEGNLLFNFFLGALVASVIWFFVWRNNKKQFASTLEDFDRSKLTAEAVNQFDKLFSKFFKK